MPIAFWSKVFSALCFFYLIVFSVLGTAEEKIPNPTSKPTSQKALLWISEKQDEKLDFIYRGFIHNNKNAFEITFIASNRRSEAYSQIDYGSYEYIVASGDSSWNFIDQLESTKTKIGIGITEKTQKQFLTTTHTNEYIISKEQPAHRVLAFIDALDLNHAQSSAFFYKESSEQKLDFIQHAKAHSVPFEYLTITKKTNTIEAINSVHHCCRILYLKDNDFESTMQKHRSILFESYRRKIITIGNRAEMLDLGAMYVIYTPEHMLGKQAAQLVTNLINNTLIANFQLPKEFVIDSNHALKATVDQALVKSSDGELIKKTILSEQLSDEDIAP